MTLRMVLAEACHHPSGPFPPSLQERRVAGLEAYEAQRGQNTARTGGKRPGLPPEPAPQVRVATIGCVAAVVPLL